MSTTILLRADASDQIGAGHVMRMIALGQMVQDRGVRVCMVTATQSPAILQRIAAEGFQMVRLDGTVTGNPSDAENVIQAGRRLGVDWVVLDGYPFVTAYQQRIKQAGFRLMCVDDIAACHYVADIVLNQNINARRHSYSVAPNTRLVLGPENALLRREFRLAKGNRAPAPERIKKVVVTMGAVDSRNVTAHVLSRLDDFSGGPLHIKAVLGALNPHHRNVSAIAGRTNNRVEILRNVGTEMADLFDWADLVISAAGSTIFEALYLDAALICHQAAINQEANLVSASLGSDGQRQAVIDTLETPDCRFYAIDPMPVDLFDIGLLMAGADG